ncbi:hypothetical protein R6Q59_031578 [Mikania micrantha]
MMTTLIDYRLLDLRSHRIHFALPVTVTVTTIDLRGPNRRVPSSFRSSPGLLLSPPLTGCHRAAHKRLLLTPLTGAFFLPPLTGAFFLPLLTGPLLLPLLTGPLLLPPLTTSCSLVVVCFSKRQTKLIQDENQLLENIIRMLLQELAAAFQSGEKTMQHGESIDDGENTHGQLPRLLEMSTMKNCEDVFGYIESKQHILGKPELFARGKLVMLRTCNQLLRRLSMANDMVFCGRIIMFLAHFFPLSERSAFNFKGLFNVSKETKYENQQAQQRL